MAVRIRMKKFGRRHRPFFRICVMDAASPRNGKAIEEVGYYDPMVRQKADRVQLKMDRIEYWISVGAQPSDKVATLIKKVRSNKFGTPSEPPPLTPPKAPPPKEPAAEEAGAAEETSPEGAEGEAASAEQQSASATATATEETSTGTEPGDEGEQKGEA